MPQSLLRGGLKMSHIRLLAALAERGQISGAADVLGITQPAASRLASEAESITGTALYSRTGRGITLSAAGEVLALRATRILQEIEDAGRDLVELAQGKTGHVNIGSVTGPAIERVLPAIRILRINNPGITPRVEIASSDVLGPMLLNGELDFALCRLPSGYDPALFEKRSLAKEPISFIVRNGHPLLRRSPATTDEMLNQDWVLPSEGAILRTTVENALKDRDMPMPRRILTTSSFLFTLAMIRQTNAIAPLATAVVEAFNAEPGIPGPIAALSTEFDLSVETYSLMTRGGQVLTPAAATAYQLFEEGA